MLSLLQPDLGVTAGLLKDDWEIHTKKESVAAIELNRLSFRPGAQLQHARPTWMHMHAKRNGKYTMSLKCPVCHSKFSLSQSIHEENMSELVDLAAKFGKNWELIFSYTECFRPSQFGSVGESKRLRLLKDIDKLFTSTAFEYDCKRYRTDWAKIIGALRIVVDCEKYGFKNHNYLKKVLLGEKAETVSAEGLTAKQEAKREKDRKSPSPPAGEGRGGENITLAEFKKRQDIDKLTDLIGRKVE